MNMHERFTKLINSRNDCGCGSCGNCEDFADGCEVFCKKNQVNYSEYGSPCVYIWRDGSRTETISYGPGDVRLAEEKQ